MERDREKSSTCFIQAVTHLFIEKYSEDIQHGSFLQTNYNLGQKELEHLVCLNIRVCDQLVVDRCNTQP